MSKSAYAIDFGTSNSLVSYIHSNHKTKVLKIDENHSDPFTMRSLMYFPFEKLDPSFGHEAIQNYVKEDGQGRFIRSIKKFLPSKSFKATQIQGHLYTLEEIIGRFLTELKTRSDQLTGEDVTSVMLGRPAKFSNDPIKDQLAQDRLYKAAEMAGFKKIGFCPEPLAAALDYQSQIQKNKRVLVVDLGGGTSDFSVIELKPGKNISLETLGLGGLSIAGDKLDGTLMTEHIGPHFGTKVQYKMPLANNVITMPPALKSKLMSPADITIMSRTEIMSFIREIKNSTVSKNDKNNLENLFSLVENNLGFALYEEVERCKRMLCTHHSDQFQFKSNDIDIKEKLTYNNFIDCNQKNFNNIFSTMQNVLENSGLEISDIDTIFTTGGTSKVPYVQDYLVKSFGAKKLHNQESFHSVIKGLAVKACELL